MGHFWKQGFTAAFKQNIAVIALDTSDDMLHAKSGLSHLLSPPKIPSLWLVVVLTLLG